MTADILDCFSESYEEARDKFHRAAAAAGAVVDPFKHRGEAPSGAELVTDVARFGTDKAKRVLIMVSGTHGVEGLCGAGCQVRWLRSGGPARIPGGVAVVVVHLVNPYGVAWIQQETSEGFNLNRNYVDHSAPYPEAPLYAELHDALLCPDLEGKRFEAAQAVIADFRARHGQEGILRAVFGGQFHWPNGANFGGNKPAWARRVLLDILARHAGTAEDVAVLDYHTGLGPYGQGTLIIFCAESDPLVARTSAWFPGGVFRVPGPETPGGIVGQTGNGCIQALPNAVVTPVTVEFGTFDIETECRVVQQDLWLRNHGDPKSELGRRIKSELRGYFYPTAADWREKVCARSDDVIGAALAGLSSGTR